MRFLKTPYTVLYKVTSSIVVITELLVLKLLCIDDNINPDYVWSHTYSKSMDQPSKVANPARGQLNKENQYFPVRVRA